MLSEKIKQDFLAILGEELIPAMGCTEPIALAFAAAKASCAVKISSALDAAMFAHALAMRGKAYESNTGILQKDTGDTISCVGHIGRVGMEPTDREIVKIMIQP